MARLTNDGNAYGPLSGPRTTAPIERGEDADAKRAEMVRRAFEEDRMHIEENLESGDDDAPRRLW